ncbi:glycosyltransferase family 4 protein [Neobacillus muris]|uniref:glycosyltransferase family 4 protein n=1 Tax=Neobacillus muris TaxID=2941334 RepID=UPI00203E79CA|nr:glycosyltransferase family 4 protein [Neobacillus muris]
MQNKVLFCATVDHHFESFHIPYLKWFKEQGWRVHVAANGNVSLPYVDQKFNLSIQRSPFSLKNIKAYKELKEIINQNQYQMIHCHTPMGGVLTRIAARNQRKFGSKVLYTAHGFHFFKGAPLINWALYYPIEKMLAKYTDCLITINKEDFYLANNRQFKADYIKHVHGVGINTEVFSRIEPLQKAVLRQKHGYKQEDFLLFYAAEFNKNKNQQMLIKAVANIKQEVPNAKLLLAGDGPLLENCKKLALKLGLKDMVHFLGFRLNIDEFLKISDLAVASSYREGLPVNIMEAMASGLPVLASDNRGHRELIINDKNGWLIKADHVGQMSEKIKILVQHEELRSRFGKMSRKIIEETYSIEKTLKEKSLLYSMLMEELEEREWAVH